MKIVDILQERAATAPPGLTDFPDFVTDTDPVVRQEWAWENLSAIRELLKTECSEWISASGGELSYRGVGNSFPGLPVFTQPVRKDRRPRSSSPETHEWMQWLLKTAGSRALRDNSLFVTGVPAIAASYGQPQIVFPMGSFSYTWAPGVEDWYRMRFAGSKMPSLGWLDPERVAQSPGFQEELSAEIVILEPDQEEAYKRGGAVGLARQLIQDGNTAVMFSITDTSLYDPERVRAGIKVDEGLPEALKQGAEIMVACEKALYMDLHVFQVVKEG